MADRAPEDFDPIVGTPLSEADGRVLDRLLDARLGETGHLSPADAPRAERVQRVLSLLDAYPDESAPEDLAARTMARVASAKKLEQLTQRTGAVRGPFVSFQWRELLTVGALVMIGLSLMLPVLSRMNSDSRKLACQNNLAMAGSAVGTYAADFGNFMPRLGNWTNMDWWRVGQDAQARDAEPARPHTPPLHILLRAGYARPEHLTCPENAFAVLVSPGQRDFSEYRRVSYSYQNQFTDQPIRVDALPTMAVLADKNPLFVIQGQGRFVFRSDLPTDAVSAFHSRLKGQNVLTADGNVTWKAQPVVGEEDDNIWTAQGVATYEGRESPSSLFDSFLVP